MIKKIINKVNQKVIELKIHSDQRGGPGLEESGSMIFILIPVLAGLAVLGALVTNAFDSVAVSIKSGLGI